MRRLWCNRQEKFARVDVCNCEWQRVVCVMESALCVDLHPLPVGCVLPSPSLFFVKPGFGGVTQRIVAQSYALRVRKSPDTFAKNGAQIVASGERRLFPVLRRVPVSILFVYRSSGGSALTRWWCETSKMNLVNLSAVSNT